MTCLVKTICLVTLVSIFLSVHSADRYENFDVAIYCRVYEVIKMEDI